MKRTFGAPFTSSKLRQMQHSLLKKQTQPLTNVWSLVLTPKLRRASGLAQKRRTPAIFKRQSSVAALPAGGVHQTRYAFSCLRRGPEPVRDAPSGSLFFGARAAIKSAISFGESILHIPARNLSIRSIPMRVLRRDSTS